MSLLQAKLFANDVLVVVASALYLSVAETKLPSSAPVMKSHLPGPEQLQEKNFSSFLFGQSDKLPSGLHNCVRLKPVSELSESGKGCAWLKLPVLLLDGVPNKASVVAATLADFANGVGQLSLGGDMGTINVDLQMQLSRNPSGDWLALDCCTLMQPNGIGQVTSQLFDVEGRVGQVFQTVIPMSGGN